MGILQARTLEWVAMPSSRGSSWPRGWTRVSCSSLYCSQILYHWATKKALTGQNFDAKYPENWETHRRHGLQPTRLLCPWDFPGKSTGVGGLPLPSLYSWAEFKRIQFFVGVSAFSQIKEFRKKFHLLIFKCSQLKIICVSQLYILDSFNMYVRTHI